MKDSIKALEKMLGEMGHEIDSLIQFIDQAFSYALSELRDGVGTIENQIDNIYNQHIQLKNEVYYLKTQVKEMEEKES